MTSSSFASGHHLGLPYETLSFTLRSTETCLVHIGNHLNEFIAKDLIHSDVGRFIRYFVVITDELVAEHYLLSLKNAFSAFDVHLHVFMLPLGDELFIKTRKTKERIENFLLDLGCTRSETLLISLGGGVICDLTGFVASTYMRGVPVVHLPTTLLSMVDASIGGKTGVNTPHGKNLIGTFYQPKRIYLDVNYLTCLPRRQLSNGLAEIIKMAAILDASFFCWLEESHHAIGILDERHSTLFCEVISRSVKLKIQVILEDEFEVKGVRSLLNFGHTVGHAIETLGNSQWLHGEAVSIGIIKETEIARYLGHVSSTDVARLYRCLKMYELPVAYPSKILPLAQMMKTMSVDKKTDQKGFKKIVLLSRLGCCVQGKAQPVDDSIIRFILSQEIEIVPIDKTRLNEHPIIHLKVPGSKSVSNRALILAALGQGSCSLRGFLHSDDTAVCIEALRQMGCSINLKARSPLTVESPEGFEPHSELLEQELVLIVGTSGRLKVPQRNLYLGNAGTAARFLTTVGALISIGDIEGPEVSTKKQFITLTGDARMRERPIGDLVETLNRNGCTIRYMGEHEGCLPIEIEVKETPWRGGQMKLNASMSSQFVSSLLLSAPYATESIQLELFGDEVVSKSYIDLTMAMMSSFGVEVEQENCQRNSDGHCRLVIPRAIYQNPTFYDVEGDASSATYPLALAALTGATVLVENVGSSSLQGDAAFCRLLRDMGCRVIQNSTTTQVTGLSFLQTFDEFSRDDRERPLLKAIDVDMSSMTDAFMTAAVVMAVARGTSRIRHVANQRVKECNRIAVMAHHLSACGVPTEETEDGLVIHGLAGAKNLRPTRIECHNDHRIAMSFAILGCIQPGIVIDDKSCVEKTYPEFWDHLHRYFGVDLKPAITTDYIDEQSKRVKHINTSEPHSWIVIGMRGAGKSTLAKALALHKNWNFVDMDTLFEERHECSILSFVSQFGWDAFRETETKTMADTLIKYPTHTIIACGGGIVENPRARSLLANYPRVVTLWKSLNDLTWALETSDMVDGERKEDRHAHQRRPSLPDSLATTYRRRHSYFHQVSSLFFPIADGERDWNRITHEWIMFIEQLELNRDPIAYLQEFESPSSLTYGSSVLSLTLTDLGSISTETWSRMISGVQAVELRADFLSCLENDFMMDQLARLRRLQHEYNIVTVFTLRTHLQGGNFLLEEKSKEACFKRIESLMKLAASTGVSFLDIEHDWPPYLIENIVHDIWPARIILSHHDVEGRDTIEALVNRFNIMSEQRYASILKLVRYAQSTADGLAFWSIITQQKQRACSPPKPTLVVAMGEHGRITRGLQKFLSPVSHPDLPRIAAPGQMSLSELNRLRVTMGLLRPQYLYLFGSPIGRSMSPITHSTFFDYFGLPHRYGLCESSDPSYEIKTLLESSNFGGASITIPLKERILPLVSELDESDAMVGSVNTIVIDRRISDDKHSKRLIGYNTDWQAILRVLTERVSETCIGGSALVLGAGGSARAACHALRQWKLPSDQLYIYNRSPDRGRLLAESFSGTFLDSWDPLYGTSLRVIITTLPADAQESLVDVLPSFLWHTKPLLIEMAYRPMRTRLIQLAEHHQSPICLGIHVFYYQAILQFQLWTGLHIPDKDLIEDLMEKYLKQEQSC